MDGGTKILRSVFLAILAVQLCITVCVPLIHLMNDSGWYYMNVHYLTTGQYITESRYPSFTEPSLYYPYFGYSLFLYVCERIHHFTGMEFAVLVKYAQFLMYAFSGILLRKIVLQLSENQKLAYGMGIVFLLYYPYFNYVNLLMSETYVTFLLLLTVYSFLRTQQSPSAKNTIVFFLLAGYLVLVKPVLLPVSGVMALFFIVTVLRQKEYRRLIAVGCIALFPILQITFNTLRFDQSVLQTGTGWHLWDRVISYDKQIPQHSANFKRLKAIYRQHHRPVAYGYWWDVTKDLSEFGYNEVETQAICKGIAVDGIKEKPFYYFLNTFKNSAINFTTNNTDNQVFPTLREYEEQSIGFATERQHQPLSKQLLQQFDGQPNVFSAMILQFNRHYASASSLFNNIYHNSVVLALFVLTGLIVIFRLLKSRFISNQNEFVIWFTGFFIVFGSNMAEYPSARVMQPAVIFILLSIVLMIRSFLPLLPKKQH